ncbi:MAG TPA: hypothetical protein VNW30_05610 [Opitutaceae bacterium]|nr:hypothetical protein [Opitutaceae bacterium]
MKLRALFVKSLFLAISLSITGPLLAQYMSGSTPAPNSSDETKPPAAKVKHEIPGITIPRANGGFLGLEIDSNSNFKLSFYDKDKAPVAVDLPLATIRWHDSKTTSKEFVALNPGGDGTCLTSDRIIRRPWMFKLTILLYAAGSNDPAESYTLDYNG